MTHISINPTLVDTDKGLFIRYTPTLKTSCQVTGEIKFAFFEESVGSCLAWHDQAKENALRAACETLKHITYVNENGIYK